MCLIKFKYNNENKGNLVSLSYFSNNYRFLFCIAFLKSKRKIKK